MVAEEAQKVREERVRGFGNINRRGREAVRRRSHRRTVEGVPSPHGRGLECLRPTRTDTKLGSRLALEMSPEQVLALREAVGPHLF